MCKFTLHNFDDINICKTMSLTILQKSQVKMGINVKQKHKAQFPLLTLQNYIIDPMWNINFITQYIEIMK